MSEIALVYVLFGDRSSAQAVAREMVEQRLAACANILGEGQSIYPWEDRIEEATEVPVLFKTGSARRDALMDALAARHDYDVPAILNWSASVTPAYAAWVAKETAC